MYCPRCGWQNPDDAEHCANCGADLRAEVPQEPDEGPQPSHAEPPYEQPPYVRGPYDNIPDYLTLSIVATIITTLCCSPIALVLSIIALVKASGANRKRAAGYYNEARMDANLARNMLIAAAIVWVLGMIFGAIWQFSYGGRPRMGGGRWI